MGPLTSLDEAQEPSLLIKRLESLKERATRPSSTADYDSCDERPARKRWLRSVDISSLRVGVQAFVSVAVAVTLHMWDVTYRAYDG